MSTVQSLYLVRNPRRRGSLRHKVSDHEIPRFFFLSVLPPPFPISTICFCYLFFCRRARSESRWRRAQRLAAPSPDQTYGQAPHLTCFIMSGKQTLNPHSSTRQAAEDVNVAIICLDLIKGRGGGRVRKVRRRNWQKERKLGLGWTRLGGGGKGGVEGCAVGSQV